MALQISLARTISEVVDQLDRIIAWSIEASNRIGYFACLYRKVTIAVKEGVETGLFEDGPRMERLDVIFANRFLEAFQRHQSLQPCSASWQLAFQQARIWRPLVLQHLMLGMNAHINLDLGIAAAETMRGGDIGEIKDDFYKINDILLDLIDEVQEQLATIFPLLRRIDLIGRFDEVLAGAGIDIARRQAWSIAESFAVLPESAWEAKVDELDQKILQGSHRILQPADSLWVQLGLFFVRLGEYHPVSKKISLLR